MSRLARFRSVVSRPLITRMLHDSKLPYVVMSTATRADKSLERDVECGFSAETPPPPEIWMATQINNEAVKDGWRRTDAEKDADDQPCELEDLFNDRED